MSVMNFPNLHNYRWYHGDINRSKTEQLLQGKLPGTYLVRDDLSSPWKLILSVVSENEKVNHYRIDFMVNYYKFGGRMFADVPSIISFFKEHSLEKTTLNNMVEREMKVVACFNFDGLDPEDLSFKRDDVLTIVSMDEESWWTAENKNGQRGSIPVPYVHIVNRDNR